MTIRTSKRTAALAANHLNINPAELFDMTPNKIAALIRTLSGGVLVNAKADRPRITMSPALKAKIKAKRK